MNGRRERREGAYEHGGRRREVAVIQLVVVEVECGGEVEPARDGVFGDEFGTHAIASSEVEVGGVERCVRRGSGGEELEPLNDIGGVMVVEGSGERVLFPLLDVVQFKGGDKFRVEVWVTERDVG